MTNDGFFTNEQKDHVGTVLSLISLMLTFITFANKAKKFASLSYSLAPVYVFAQGILSEYESTMPQLVLEEIGLKPEQQSIGTQPSLQDIQESVREYIFTERGLEHNFLTTFQTSLDTQKQKIQRLKENHLAKEDTLVKELLTGEDYWRTSSFGNVKSFKDLFLPFNKLKTIEKPFRAIDTMFRKTYSIEKNTVVINIDSGIKLVVGGIPSALVSTLLINLDHIGRIIGKNLALLTKLSLGLPISDKLARYVAPITLSALFLYKEVTDFMLEFSVGFIHKGFFYPLCTGIAVGMYEALVKEQPDLIKKLQNNSSLIPSETTNDNRSWVQIFKGCYDKARKYHERYDETFKNQNGEKIMQENFACKVGSSKKILEGRRTFFTICKKCKYTEYVKEVLLIARASILMLQMFAAKIVFSVAKTVIEPAYELSRGILSIIKNVPSNPSTKEPKTNELTKIVDKK
jgi:hypothetical protein